MSFLVSNPSQEEDSNNQSNLQPRLVINTYKHPLFILEYVELSYDINS